MPKETVPGRTAARAALVCFYLTAGVAHLTLPGTFLRVVPGWVPFPEFTVMATGLCEIAGALGLVTRSLRQASGIALAAYAVCVFPANIKHAIDNLGGGQGGWGWWYHAPRLALQPAIVWWALFAGEVVRWPFTGGGKRLILDPRQ